VHGRQQPELSDRLIRLGKHCERETRPRLGFMLTQWRIGNFLIITQNLYKLPLFCYSFIHSLKYSHPVSLYNLAYNMMRKF